MNDLKNREDIPLLLPNDCVGCELGVFLCEFSDVLLSSNKFSKLYLVDTFSGVVGSGDKRGDNIKNYNGQDLLTHANNKYINNAIVSVIQQDSFSFLRSFGPQTFDFIYIDTVHTYPHLTMELEEAHKVIKKNGLICGHDYNANVFPGVVKAVHNFCEKYSLSFKLTTEDHLESFVIQL